MKATLDNPTIRPASRRHAAAEPETFRAVNTFTIPAGYMTGEEFERRVISGLEKRLKANGYL